MLKALERTDSIQFLFWFHISLVFVRCKLLLDYVLYLYHQLLLLNMEIAELIQEHYAKTQWDVL